MQKKKKKKNPTSSLDAQQAVPPVLDRCVAYPLRFNVEWLLQSFYVCFSVLWLPVSHKARLKEIIRNRGRQTKWGGGVERKYAEHHVIPGLVVELEGVANSINVSSKGITVRYTTPTLPPTVSGQRSRSSVIIAGKYEVMKRLTSNY